MRSRSKNITYYYIHKVVPAEGSYFYYISYHITSCPNSFRIYTTTHRTQNTTPHTTQVPSTLYNYRYISLTLQKSPAKLSIVFKSPHPTHIVQVLLGSAFCFCILEAPRSSSVCIYLLSHFSCLSGKELNTRQRSIHTYTVSIHRFFLY